MSTLPNAGAVLAAERERQSLSRSDIAHRLHMSTSQVEALETGDYARLPRGTFLRGFVRNYAKAVGLDPNPIIESLAIEAPEHSRPGLVVASQNIRFDPIGDRLSNPYVKAAGLATVVISVCFAAMYWWLFIRTSPPVSTSAARKVVVAGAPKAVEPPLPAPVEAPRYVEPVPVAPAKIDPPPKPEPAKAAPPKPEPAKAAPPKSEPAFASPASSSVNSESTLPNTVDAGSVIAAGGSVIRLKFRGTAWVEIKDGRGKILLSRNQPGGSEAEVIGKGPFTVVVGNAPEVQMFLNDRPFDLEPHTKVAVARFTIN